jgi:hypothetical protein
MNNIKRIGVIIQGPLVSFGQGPNNSPTGFETGCVARQKFSGDI